MKSKTCLSILLIFSCCVYVNGQDRNADFQTITYYQNDSLKLELDLFLPSNTNGEKTPLMIFVHGGGFRNGSPESGHAFCRFLAKNGIAAAAIRYTLYMKGDDKSFSCDGYLTEKIKAIRIAANQFLLSTSFFLENSEKYNIDKNKVFSAGSSAGSETILNATFWNRDEMDLYGKSLPESFTYAGVVALKGAVLDINHITKENAVPLMLVHGTCDEKVPYETAAHHYCSVNDPGWLVMYGSHTIHDHLTAMDRSSYLITYCGFGHGWSPSALETEKEAILWFMNKALTKEKFQIHRVIPTESDCEKSSKYSFCN